MRLPHCTALADIIPLYGWLDHDLQLATRTVLSDLEGQLIADLVNFVFGLLTKCRSP
jgi:hypothetical protein